MRPAVFVCHPPLQRATTCLFFESYERYFENPSNVFPIIYHKLRVHPSFCKHVFRDTSLFRHGSLFGGSLRSSGLSSPDECTKISKTTLDHRDEGRSGIESCNTTLIDQYHLLNNDTKGGLDYNLVGECDNTDVPDYDFSTCELNTYMCCWTENDGQGMQDNTVRLLHTLFLALGPCMYRRQPYAITRGRFGSPRRPVSSARCGLQLPFLFRSLVLLQSKPVVDTRTSNKTVFHPISPSDSAAFCLVGKCARRTSVT